MLLHYKTLSLIGLLLVNIITNYAYPQPVLILPQVKADYIAIDIQGNIYCIEDSKLSKYSPEGSLLATFNRYSLGSITTINVSNRMKIMLFYKESGTILFLDDQLSPISEELNLFTKNLYNITLASYSTTNHIWLYNHFTEELLTLDFHLNIIQKYRLDLEDVNPVGLIEIKEKIMVLQHPYAGLLFFDAFGTFIKKIAILTHNPIQIINTTIYYIKDGILEEYDYQKLEKQISDFQIDNAKQILKYRNRHIVLTDAGSVAIY